MACKPKPAGVVIVTEGFTSKPVVQEEKSREESLSLHVENVLRTWTFVKNDLVGNGTVFYLRLFSENPELKSLFPAKMLLKNDEEQTLQRQAKKLMSMIDYAIGCLDNLESLVPKLKKLGKRHFVKYHVRTEHFEPVGDALLWTLEKGLGDLYTRDVKSAWTAIFSILADVMIEGGKEGLAEAEDRCTGDK